MPEEAMGRNSGSDRQFVCRRMLGGEFYRIQSRGGILARLVILEHLDEGHLHLWLVPTLHIEIAEGVIEANGSAGSEIEALGAAGLLRPVNGLFGQQERR